MSVNNNLLGYENGWQNQIRYSVPTEYKLAVPQNPIRIYRKIVKRDVDTSMPITNINPLIRWRIPGSGQTLLDFRKAKVILELNVSVNLPWLARASSLVWNIIDRFRLEQNGQYVEDRRYYNLQESLSYTTQTHIVQQVTTGVALYGQGSQALRNTRAGGFKYILPIPTTALTKGIYPWFMLGTNMLNRGKGSMQTVSIGDTYLQWELVPPEQFVEVYGGFGPITGLSWQITRMQIEYEEVSNDVISGGIGRIMSQWLPEDGTALRGPYPRIFFRSWLTNVYPVTTNTEQTITIDYKLASIMSIFATFRYTAETSDPTVYYKHVKYLSSLDFNMIEYQWEVNNCLWPDKPISMVDPGKTEAYAKYLEAFQMFHSRGISQEVTPITLNQFLDDKFIAVFDGNMNPFSPLMLNPISTSNSGGKIYFRFKFSVPPPAGLEVVVHAYHWKCWNFGSNGDVPITEQ